jgi:hypothetical protein
VEYFFLWNRNRGESVGQLGSLLVVGDANAALATALTPNNGWQKGYGICLPGEDVGE